MAAAKELKLRIRDMYRKIRKSRVQCPIKKSNVQGPRSKVCFRYRSSFWPASVEAARRGRLSASKQTLDFGLSTLDFGSLGTLSDGSFSAAKIKPMRAARSINPDRPVVADKRGAILR